MEKHIQLRIIGRVQGVWYRASALRKAQELGLRGFVRNEADGSVYVEAEGEESVLQTFIAWCRVGPPLAEVREIKKSEGPWQDFCEFEVRR